MKKISVIAAILMASINANAENWVNLGTDSVFTTYVDSDSISKSGEYTKVFVLHDFLEVRQLNLYEKVDSIISLDEYNCNSNPKTFRTLSIRGFYNHNVVATKRLSQEEEYLYPGSTGEAIANFVCSF